jgi:hypothetical protein
LFDTSSSKLYANYVVDFVNYSFCLIDVWILYFIFLYLIAYFIFFIKLYII